MKLSERMRAGLVISALLHAVLLVWGLVSFVAKPLASTPTDASADIVTVDEFVKLTSGQKDAPKAPAPKPVVEKIDTVKPVEDIKIKPVEKKEILRTTDNDTPPPPPMQKSEKPKVEQPKPDPIAEALKKDEAKKEEKKDEPKKVEVKPEPPKPPIKHRDFNPGKIAMLLDKRKPQRQAAAGAVLNTTPTQSENAGDKDASMGPYFLALISRLRKCWLPDGGGLRSEDFLIQITAYFNRDGSLSAAPHLDTQPRSPREQAVADSVLRAINSCAPYTMLPVAQYEKWKVTPIDFCTNENGVCK